MSLLSSEGLNLYVNASGKIQLHQCIYGLRRWIENVHQTFMRANFKLLPSLLIHVRKTVHLFFTVGNGIGPATRAPVRFAVSTISVVD